MPTYTARRIKPLTTTKIAGIAGTTATALDDRFQRDFRVPYNRESYLHGNNKVAMCLLKLIADEGDMREKSNVPLPISQTTEDAQKVSSSRRL